MTRRGEYALALLGLVAGAVLALVALGRSWATIQVDTGLGTDVLRATGKDLAPVAGAAPLVALAGVIAVVATRRVGRAITGSVLVALGIGMAAAAAAVVVALDSRAGEWARVQTGEVIPAESVDGSAWPWVVIVGAGLIAAAGLFVVLRGRDWPVMGARYERPGPGSSRPTSVGGEHRDVWDALDRGEDPTVRE